MTQQAVRKRYRVDGKIDGNCREEVYMASEEFGVSILQICIAIEAVGNSYTAIREYLEKWRK